MVTALGEQLRLVHLVRDFGWDSLWTGQHFLTDSSSQLSPTVTMARLAAEAGEMEIGLGVLLLALLNPVDVAEQVASLDVVCGGRAVLGVGLGYRQVEFDAFGIHKSGARARFVENLRIVRSLLAGQTVDADLPWCRLRSATVSVRPARRPGVPVWLGADADGAVRRAARLGDAWMVNPHTTLPTVIRQIELYQATRAGAGLPPPAELPVIREVLCAATQERAEELAARHLEQKYRAYAAWGQDKVLPAGESFDLPFEALASQRFVVGTPQRCYDQLAAWRRMVGATHFVLRTHWAGMAVDDAATSIELLSKEVLPELRRVRPEARPTGGAT
jgi:alkanesulfonate monooxygenase SsuD/methylene tetrahydromethanopterin reductase-like flavin-dependent oxidoreductase (luciferase family)